MATIIKSRKGQGLGFVAVIILVALLYFIFRYNTEAYNFVMTAGDQQAHLVTSYVETEKAKFFSETALEQAAYETAWKCGATSCSDFSAKVCNRTDEFLDNTTSIFYSYLSRYEPSMADLSTSFPDYDFSIDPAKCNNNGIEIEAFGFAQFCYLRAGYPFPKVPCIDQLNKTDCDAVQLTTGGQACKWDVAKEFCGELNTAPDCEGIIDKSACETNSDCRWDISYSENINVMSISLSNYQFSIDSDAHFIEKIDCTGFNKFAETRKNVQAFKPVCTIGVQPPSGNTSSIFAFNVVYKGESLNAIDVKVTNSTGSESKITLTEVDIADKDYLDGKYYNATKTFANADNYTATVACSDASRHTASSSKSFKVT